MKLYNTMSRRVEPFQPKHEKVEVYVCGITPYDTTHLGHAFTYASMDVLIRYLEMRGLKVEYVQNVTDIDDDILRKANQATEDWRLLGARWTNHFIQDMVNLNVRAPDRFPSATEVINDIVRSVEKLIKAGVAYEREGNVYFSIRQWPEFGKLSQLPPAEMLPVANERGNHPEDPHKLNPLDFVLWQAQAPGEPAWPSPWGMGRPGWHIECSTMSTKYLGDQIDIHGGGVDLCFPHHECEIAQVESVTGKEPFVRYWIHTAMVSHDGDKMSKSLGNLVMVRDLLEEYSADAIRLYLASHHYRDPWSYDEGDLKKAAKTAAKLTGAAQADGGDGTALSADSAWAAFTNDMDNDLDTPGAIKVLEGLADEILDAAMAGRDVQEAQDALRTFGRVLGLRLDAAKPGEEAEKWMKYTRNQV